MHTLIASILCNFKMNNDIALPSKIRNLFVEGEKQREALEAEDVDRTVRQISDEMCRHAKNGDRDQVLLYSCHSFVPKVIARLRTMGYSEKMINLADNTGTPVSESAWTCLDMDYRCVAIEPFWINPEPTNSE